MLSHTFDRIVELRNKVGGEGTFVLAGVMGCIARLDDEGWSFMRCSGSWRFVVDDWLCVESLDALCSATICS